MCLHSRHRNISTFARVSTWLSVSQKEKKKNPLCPKAKKCYRRCVRMGIRIFLAAFFFSHNPTKCKECTKGVPCAALRNAGVQEPDWLFESLRAFIVASACAAPEPCVTVVLQLVCSTSYVILKPTVRFSFFFCFLSWPEDLGLRKEVVVGKLTLLPFLLSCYA